MELDSAQATIFIIDNSPASINGDFYPNRLEAQVDSIQYLSQYLFQSSAKAEIGLCTMSSQVGVISSFVHDLRPLRSVLNKIEVGKTPCSLVQSIKCCLLALRHRDEDVRSSRIILFLHSQHDLTPSHIPTLTATLNNSAVFFDIVTFGNDPIDIDTLTTLQKGLVCKSHHVHINPTMASLSDLVYSSEIGPGPNAAPPSQNPDNDPNLELALRLSRQEANLPPPTAPGEEELINRDPELLRALEESRREAGIVDNDEELRLAIEQSRQEFHDQGEDEMTPELSEAIRLSMMDGNEEHQQNDEEEEMTEEMNEAIRLSMMDGNEPQKQNGEEEEMNEAIRLSMMDENKTQQQNDEEEEMTEEILEAIRLSMQDSNENQVKDELKELQDDDEAMKELMKELPGVDPNDPNLYKKEEKK